MLELVIMLGMTIVVVLTVAFTKNKKRFLVDCCCVYSIWLIILTWKYVPMELSELKLWVSILLANAIYLPIAIKFDGYEEEFAEKEDYTNIINHKVFVGCESSV